jgi:molybdopterin synthase sulfur carrier subunit
MRTLTSGQTEVVVEGVTVREVIDRLEALYPGTKSQLVRDDQLRPGLTVAIDSAVSSAGLRQSVKPDSEVHFLPAIGGG